VIEQLDNVVEVIYQFIQQESP